MSARIIMKLVVDQVIDDTADVRVVTFRHPRRPTLPGAEPGAHVDVHIPGGKIRQYSLCNDPSDPGRYRIAVKREANGRGGSRWLHDHLAPGMEIPVTVPRNNFGLSGEASRHVFIAGGIGITPFVSMVRHLSAARGDFSLHYCARTAAEAPLHAELARVCTPEQLRTWFSRDPDGQRFDASMLATPVPGTHIYCCGPASLVDAVREATAAWPAAQVHFEVFAPTLDENFKPEPFDIRLASTGETIRVPADTSALAVLRERGFPLASSCEMGVCGSCVCGYTDGVVIHRDSFLDASKRQEKLALCVSRARVGVTLDL